MWSSVRVRQIATSASSCAQIWETSLLLIPLAVLQRFMTVYRPVHQTF
jgi:hypothetical protein